MSEHPLRICIVYPADPAGSVAGGIDTFIRGEINYAPPDIEYSVIGITTDTTARPVGRWTTCKLKKNEFRFYPVTQVEFTDRNPIIPITIKYMMNLGGIRRRIEADVLEFHRVEPLLQFRRDARPKTAVFHQNMQSLYDKQADIRWSRMPGLYFWFEDRLVPDLGSIFCVRADATEHYRSRYPLLAENCHFQPTWADPDQFRPAAPVERREIRARIAKELGIDDGDRWLISVGRLNKQKDPQLMIETLAELSGRGRGDFTLLLVGEGPLRDSIRARAAEKGIGDKLRFLGLRGVDEVSELLRAADLFVLSSAYEGMPMAVIEALASGVPVATTRVGEVGRVVQDRVCGAIAEDRTRKSLCDAVEWCLSNLERISGQHCLEAASRFSPVAVLDPIYENYRRLAGCAV